MLVRDFIKSLPTKAGVYKFYVYSLNKYYIGESVSIRRRVLEHLNGNGKKAIRKAILENGVDDIGFEILHFEDNRDNRIALEQHYKCYYGFDNLLNMISVKENGSCAKAVLSFTKEGKFVKRFNSVSEAAVFANREVGTLSDGCLGKAVFVAGYTWFLEDDYTEGKLQQRLLDARVSRMRNRHRVSNLCRSNGENTKKFILGQNATEEYIFMSLSDAARYFNTSITNISACCLGREKQIKNLKWSYINE